ncbi:MAG: hypothetical protein GTO14_02805 [Anaerolineales bacterium]|nr:hypothetical protein [Anaerolineales bacterium]
MASNEYEYAFLGGLRQDYFITHDGRSYQDILGGNAVYAAVGARMWADSVGIFSRVGSNFPEAWIKQLSEAGFATDGIVILPEPHDTRTFYAYISPEERVDTNPAAHYLRINQPLPKELVGYRSSTEWQDNRETFGPLAIRPSDLSEQTSRLRGVHLAPGDYLTHASIPYRLRELGVPLISLDPSTRYMDPSFQSELPVIVNGLDAFLPSEAETKAFFQPVGMDIWEMCESFGTMGCRFVVIKCGARGQVLWDSESKDRWRIPAYPAQLKDATGAGDAFCGGFLVGLDRTNDPVEAALYGSVSASHTIEGTGALYALNTLPELVHARLEALRSLVRKI